jgi:hypothetical protein
VLGGWSDLRRAGWRTHDEKPHVEPVQEGDLAVLAEGQASGGLPGRAGRRLTRSRGGQGGRSSPGRSGVIENEQVAQWVPGNELKLPGPPPWDLKQHADLTDTLPDWIWIWELTAKLFV